MAKSTSVVHLSIALAQRGVRVVVVDLDHQGAASNLLAGQPPARGTVDVLLNGAKVAEVAVATQWGVDLVAAGESLARAELALASEVGREVVLRDALAGAPGDRWDLVLIDTPPSLGLMTVNALCAATALLSPVVPAYLSLLSIRQLESTVSTVQKRLNPGLQTLGYLLCAVDGRERLSAEAREALREHVGAALWTQEVRIDTKLKTAPDAVSLKGRGAEDYRAAASELMARLGLGNGRPNSRSNRRSNERPNARTV